MTTPKCACGREAPAVIHWDGEVYCDRCTLYYDITYCGVCGIFGKREDFAFTRDGDGPHCPDCLAALEAE